MLLPKARRQRPLLVLTPLIDVLFLLLIFFMLSSQIAPYSLIPLGGVVQAVQDQAPQTSTPAPTAPSIPVRVSHGYVTIGSERTALADLKAAVDRNRQAGLTRYVVISGATAQVQDVVSALEALRLGRAAEVTLLNPARGTP